VATIKRTAVKTTQVNTAPKPAVQKGVSKTTNQTRPIKEKSGDELVAENFAALANVVASLGNTLEMLVQKTESMAYHIIATEEILAELVAANGLNLANVNTRIRVKIAAGTNNNSNANQAIDIAASIASPLPRR
jgi:DNA segregation ATPase FtsK/SpoIIIE-like protein